MAGVIFAHRASRGEVFTNKFDAVVVHHVLSASIAIPPPQQHHNTNTTRAYSAAGAMAAVEGLAAKFETTLRLHAEELPTRDRHTIKPCDRQQLISCGLATTTPPRIKKLMNCEGTSDDSDESKTKPVKFTVPLSEELPKPDENMSAFGKAVEAALRDLMRGCALTAADSRTAAETWAAKAWEVLQRPDGALAGGLTVVECKEVAGIVSHTVGRKTQRVLVKGQADILVIRHTATPKVTVVEVKCCQHSREVVKYRDTLSNIDGKHVWQVGTYARLIQEALKLDYMPDFMVVLICPDQVFTKHYPKCHGPLRDCLEEASVSCDFDARRAQVEMHEGDYPLLRSPPGDAADSATAVRHMAAVADGSATVRDVFKLGALAKLTLNELMEVFGAKTELVVDWDAAAKCAAVDAGSHDWFSGE